MSRHTIKISLFLVCVLLPIAALVTGCSTVQLTEKGKRVKLLTAIPADGQYEHIDDVSCSFGTNGRTSETNMKLCRIDLQNKAGELGGSIVVIQSQQLGTSGGIIIGGYGNTGCPNCITMLGAVYRKK
jgi:hypothetical protein